LRIINHTEDRWRTHAASPLSTSASVGGLAGRGSMPSFTRFRGEVAITPAKIPALISLGVFTQRRRVARNRWFESISLQRWDKSGGTGS
jgi:hypothetical protein